MTDLDRMAREKWPDAWLVLGAEARRAFAFEDEARKFAGDWGRVLPLYLRPPETASIAKALDAYRFYVCASDEELSKQGISRREALIRAYELDPYDGSTPTAAAIRKGDS